MKRIMIIIMGISLFSIHIGQAKTIAWTGTPITIKTTVGEEIRIDFPEKIINTDVKRKAFTYSEILLNNNGSLLWRAKAPYGRERIKLYSENETLYIVDIEAVLEGGVGKNTFTVTNDALVKKFHTNAQKIELKDNSPPGLPDFLKTDLSNVKRQSTNADYVAMARYAFNHYVGLERLRSNMIATQVTPSEIPKHWLRLRGDQLEVRMLNGWMIDHHYVTAVYVHNQSHLPYEFDPRSIRGKYQFIATINSVLQPNGMLGDDTVWVLISHKPFTEAALERR